MRTWGQENWGHATWRQGLFGWFLGTAIPIAVTSAASGYEPGFAINTMPGITSGIAAGANPPEGVYFLNFTNGGRSTFYGGGASTGIVGFKSESVTEVPLLLWSTPWTVLGANWSMLFVNPMTRVDVFNGATPVASIAGFHNPGFAPMWLSWNLGGGLFVKFGTIFWSPHGTIANGALNNGLGDIGAPYWTIEPHFAVSYLAHDLNLTANLIYGISTRNTYSGVTNGHSLTLDLTATRKFGKFEFGPIGYFSTQVTPDSGCEAFYGVGACARGTKAGVGALIGYDFGPVDVKLAVTDSIHAKNSNDGWRVWSIVSARLWAPERRQAAK